MPKNKIAVLGAFCAPTAHCSTLCWYSHYFVTHLYSTLLFSEDRNAIFYHIYLSHLFNAIVVL